MVRVIAIVTLTLTSLSAPTAAEGEGAIFARAHELHALETPADLGPDAGLVLIGDSVAGNVAAAMAPEAARRGAPFVQSTRAGCSPMGGLVVRANGKLVGSALACEAARPVWLASVAATAADAVLWLSTYDPADRLVNGELVAPGTAEGRRRTAELILAAADVVAPPGSGRRVVFLLPTPTVPDSDPAAPPIVASIIDVQRHRAILHLVVRADPERFSILNLERFLCPAGPPCPLEPAPGIRPRDPLNGHITAAGAVWLAPQIFDSLDVT